MKLSQLHVFDKRSQISSYILVEEQLMFMQ